MDPFGTNKAYSVCTYPGAKQAWKALDDLIQQMKHGIKAKILIGNGHAKLTLQGADFEYILNVE